MEKKRRKFLMVGLLVSIGAAKAAEMDNAKALVPVESESAEDKENREICEESTRKLWNMILGRTKVIPERNRSLAEIENEQVRILIAGKADVNADYDGIKTDSMLRNVTIWGNKNLRDHKTVITLLLRAGADDLAKVPDFRYHEYIETFKNDERCSRLQEQYQQFMKEEVLPKLSASLTVTDWTRDLTLLVAEYAGMKITIKK